MSEKFREEAEVRRKVILEVLGPDSNDRFLIGIVGKTQEEARTYSQAIATVLDRESIRWFHQIGDGQTPGDQYCEIRDNKVTKEQIEALIPKIEQEAEEQRRLMGPS